MGLNIDFENREALTITDFEFLSLFKKPNEKVYFRLIQEKKHIAKKIDCLLTLDDDLEYPLIQNIFKKYQKQGYGVYFVVNSGGQEKNSIKRINAHFIDMDFGKVPKIINGELFKNSEGKTVYEYRSKEEIEEYKIAFLKKLENFKLIPNVIVETKNGLHVYWLLDPEKPQSLNAFTPLQEKLIDYFASFEERKEHADSSVKDINRVLRLINYKHLKNPKDPFTIKCIYLNTDEKYTQADIANAIGYNIIELVSNTKSTEIKPVAVRAETSNLQKESHRVYSSPILQYEDLIPFLKQQDLISYLGINIRPNVNFKCIFHNDNNPSAVIKNNGGYYKYFCNSPACICHNDGKGMDIIDIVKIKENCDTSTAIRKLIEYFHIKLEDSTWINEQSKKFEINMMLLSQLGERKDEFPNLNRIIRFGYPILMDILEIGKENIINRFFSTNGESIFFFSNRYLAGKRNKSVVNINKYINLFCTLGLLNKIPYKQVNQRLRATAVQISKDNAQNGISFYTVPDYNEAFKTADERAAIMLQYKFSIKGMSKKYLENCFGEEFANQIYIVNVKDSEKSRNIRDAIESFILQQIKTYGYFTKDMIMDHKLKVDNHPVRQGVKEYEFRKVLPDIIQKYDLIYVKANNNINQKLGIDTKKYVLIQRSLLDE
ncbi:MAG: hypothetical protein WBH95_01015 [Caldicoprobacterales bacterium]